MPEVEEFLPVFPEETEESVMGRLLVWLNDGVDPGDPTWIDPREGGMARTLLVPAAREMAVLYDRISVELPAAASPLFAWGWYLDQWAIALGTNRLPATAADGIVTFTAEDGTVIPAGTEVGVDPDVSAEAPSYLTQEEAEVVSGSINVYVVASEEGVFGDMPQGTVTAILSTLEDPEATVTNPAAMTGGTDEESDELLRGRVLGIYSATPGGGNVADYVQWTRSVSGVGAVSITPEGQGPGTVLVTALSPQDVPVSDLTRKAIRDYLDPVAIELPILAVAASTISVTSTNGYRPAGIVHLGKPDLSGTERIHNYTGISASQLTGVTPAPSFTAGEVVWQTGRGGGRAPVGHHVIVGKGTIFAVNITATVELLAGYALVPRPDAVDIQAAVEAALRAYVDPLPPGAQIVLQRIESTIMGVVGVYDLTLTKINTVAGNVTADPLGTPTLGTVVLTEGLVT